MWERYCRDVNALIFVVDAADKEALPVAKEELHALLEKETVAHIPLLVLGNKSDLSEKMSVDELIEGLELKKVTSREISCYGVSAKEETNLEAVLQVSVLCPVNTLPHAQVAPLLIRVSLVVACRKKWKVGWSFQLGTSVTIAAYASQFAISFRARRYVLPSLGSSPGRSEHQKSPRKLPSSAQPIEP